MIQDEKVIEPRDLTKDEIDDFVRYKYQQIVQGITWDEIDMLSPYEVQLTIYLHGLEAEKNHKDNTDT